MNTIALHINFHLVNRQAIAPSVLARRRLASLVLGERNRESLLVFRAVDTHMHLLVLSDRPSAGRLVQRIGTALSQALGLPVPFDRAWYEPVREQRHLVKAALYILRNADNHGFNADPEQEACALPDLLGMRLLAPDLRQRAREHLGRLSRAEVESILGAPIPEPGFHPEHLREAACASLALPTLRGNDSLARRARAAAVRLARKHLLPREIAERLEIHERGVYRWAGAEEDPVMEAAIGRQMSFRAALAMREGLAGYAGHDQLPGATRIGIATASSVTSGNRGPRP